MFAEPDTDRDKNKPSSTIPSLAPCSVLLSQSFSIPREDLAPELDSDGDVPHRRPHRLLRIGTGSSSGLADNERGTAVNQQHVINESSVLSRFGKNVNSYGSLSFVPASYSSRIPQGSPGIVPGPHPNPSSPRRLLSRTSSLFRRPEVYDTPIGGKYVGDEINEAVKVNGIRVWYSSFSSIDWLHDAIKDSNRILRLRKRKSLRGYIRVGLDRTTGWIVVTIVGFLAAILAFLIVRAEQWLFDIKEGHCTQGWYRAKRFCCPTENFALSEEKESCVAWQTWSEYLDNNRGINRWLTEYVCYTIIALLLALTSCFLTINFTASTSFVGRKDSRVLSPSFPEQTGAKSSGAISGEQPRKVIYFAAGSGIPEVKTILSGFVIHGYLGGRTLVIKCIGLALSVASGLSLGKEGPLVHISACAGNIVSRYFWKYETNEGKRREILSAASAAGVAVAFGSPIGGVLFSLEEVSYFFPAKVMWRSFFCAMIAAVTLRLLDPFGTGKIVLFQVSYDKDWHAFELGFFVLIGICCGLYGAYFSKANYWWAKNVRGKTWLKSRPVLEVFLITLITAFFCFLNPYTRMGGTELVYNLFAECHKGESHEGTCPTQLEDVGPLISAIGTAMVVKGLLTVVTFGIKLPAGIFIPTLGVGACFGRIVGLAVSYLQWKYPSLSLFNACGADKDCILPGVYAMVGAAAALSGVTRTTVSLAVIMFELTDTLTYVVPVMLGILVAKTTADAVEPKGIYDLCIELAQLPYLDAKSQHQWGGLQAGDAAIRDVEVIYVDRVNTVMSLRDQLQAVVSTGDGDGGLPVLQREPGGLRMMGYIGASELEHALTTVVGDPETTCHFHRMARLTNDTSSSSSSFMEFHRGSDPFDFSKYMDHAPLSVSTHAPLELVQQFFVKLGARYVVVCSEAGFFEGVIHKKHWIAFLAEMEERRE